MKTKTKTRKAIEKKIANLSPKKVKYLQGRLEQSKTGKTKKQIAIEAGYSETQASKGLNKIETKDFMDIFMACLDQVSPIKSCIETIDTVRRKSRSESMKVSTSQYLIDAHFRARGLGGKKEAEEDQQPTIVFDIQNMICQTPPPSPRSISVK